MMWDTIVGNDWRARGDKGSASTSVAMVEGMKAMCYLFNYAGKEDQKHVPDGFKKVGRFRGCSTGLLEKIVVKSTGTYYEICRKTRLLRRWYVAKWRAIGIRWRWQGMGFIVWDGRLPYDRLMGLRV